MNQPSRRAGAIWGNFVLVLLMLMGATNHLLTGTELAFAALLLALFNALWALSKRSFEAVPEVPPARIRLLLGQRLVRSLGGRRTARQVATSTFTVELRRLHWPGIPVTVDTLDPGQPDDWQVLLDDSPITSGACTPGTSNAPAESLALGLRDGIKRILAAWIGVQTTQELLEALATHSPTLVREVVPDIVGLPQLAELLRQLVEDDLPAGDLHTVLEGIVRWGQERSGPLSAETLRPAFRHHLSSLATEGLREGDELPAWGVDEVFTTMLEHERANAIDADVQASIEEALNATLRDKHSLARPVFIATRAARAPLAQVMKALGMNALVLGPGELHASIEVEPAGVLHFPSSAPNPRDRPSR